MITGDVIHYVDYDVTTCTQTHEIVYGSISNLSLTYNRGWSIVLRLSGAFYIQLGSDNFLNCCSRFIYVILFLFWDGIYIYLQLQCIVSNATEQTHINEREEIHLAHSLRFWNIQPNGNKLLAYEMISDWPMWRKYSAAHWGGTWYEITQIGYIRFLKSHRGRLAYEKSVVFATVGPRCRITSPSADDFSRCLNFEYQNKESGRVL